MKCKTFKLSVAIVFINKWESITFETHSKYDSCTRREHRKEEHKNYIHRIFLCYLMALQMIYELKLVDHIEKMLNTTVSNTVWLWSPHWKWKKQTHMCEIHVRSITEARKMENGWDQYKHWNFKVKKKKTFVYKNHICLQLRRSQIWVLKSSVDLWVR